MRVRAPEFIRPAHAGRRAVMGGVAVGLAFFAYELAGQSAELYVAFMKSAGAGFLVMVVGAVIQRLWSGDRIKEATGPGGTGVAFEDETAAAAQKALDELNTRVTSQMADLNERLLDLERAVFKDDGSASGSGATTEE